MTVARMLLAAFVALAAGVAVENAKARPACTPGDVTGGSACGIALAAR